MSNAKDPLVLVPFHFLLFDSVQHNHRINSTPKGVWCVVTRFHKHLNPLEIHYIQMSLDVTLVMCADGYTAVLSELAGVCRGTPVEPQNSSAHIVPF